MIKRGFLVLAMTMVTSVGMSSALADYVYVDPGDWSGSRSTAQGELIGVGNQAQGGATLTWEITPVGNLLKYVYTFTRESGSDLEISHFNLETSANFPGARSIGNRGDRGQPGTLFGIKFDTESSRYELLTDRLPVWGDIFAKKGTGGFYNAGFGTDPSGSQQPTEQEQDFSAWVATPDSIPFTGVPTPAAFGGGLVLLTGLVLRRNRRQA